MTEDKVKKAAQAVIDSWNNNEGASDMQIVMNELEAVIAPSRKEQADYLYGLVNSGYWGSTHDRWFNYTIAELRKGESK